MNNIHLFYVAYFMLFFGNRGATIVVITSAYFMARCAVNVLSRQNMAAESPRNAR